MTFFIVILILLLLPLILPYIGRMFKRYFMGKVEDNMRRMMGMPTRAEEKRARKEQERQERASQREEGSGPRRYGFRNRGRNHNVGNPAEDLRMMRMYAEDVEYVVIREYSEELRFEQDETGEKIKIVYEEQVSDAEFVVIG
ncbi:MAG: hypothetical protein K2L89_04985 [Muribaculaceae bacterium]|nr:hypothetical protein [Muribaculaceae bacterium]